MAERREGVSNRKVEEGELREFGGGDGGDSGSNF